MKHSLSMKQEDPPGFLVLQSIEEPENFFFNFWNPAFNVL